MKSKQLKIGVLLSYVTTVANMIIQLSYTPIMLRILGQSEYGLYTLVGSVVSYLSLFSLGFGGAYMRFYSRYKVNDEQNEIAKLNGMFLSLFLFLSVVAMICGAILTMNFQVLLGSKITTSELSTAKILMVIMVFNLALTFPATIFSAIVSSQERFAFQQGINLATKILNPFLTIPLLLLGFKSISLVLVTTILTVSSIIINIWFCTNKLNTKFIFHGFDFALLKEISRFSFFLFLNMIIDQINWSIDKFLLGRFFGTVSVAVYGLASQINSLYLQFSTAVSNVFAPRVNLMNAKKTYDLDKQFTELFARAGRIQFIILWLIASSIVFFGRYFIAIWGGADYEDSYAVALWLIIPITIPLIQNLGIEIQRAKNLHQFRSIVYFFIAIANVVISIPLIKAYGPEGAAIGTAISLLVGNGLIMNIFYHKVIGIDMHYFWCEIGKFIPALLLPTVVGTVIMHFVRYSSVIQFLLCIILYTAVYVVCMWLLGMNESEKSLVKSPLVKLINKTK